MSPDQPQPSRSCPPQICSVMSAYVRLCPPKNMKIVLSISNPSALSAKSAVSSSSHSRLFASIRGSSPFHPFTRLYKPVTNLYKPIHKVFHKPFTNLHKPFTNQYKALQTITNQSPLMMVRTDYELITHPYAPIMNRYARIRTNMNQSQPNRTSPEQRTQVVLQKRFRDSGESGNYEYGL